MIVLVGYCHFLYDLFDVLICGFDNAVHLWPVRGRIMALDLELHIQCGDHIIVEICTIVCDDYLCDTVPTYEILFDERATKFLVTEANEATSTHFMK